MTKPNSIRHLLLALSFLTLILTGCANLESPIPFGKNTTQKVDLQELAQIDGIVKSEIDKGNFPGAVVLVGQKNKELYFKAFGNEVIEPFIEPMTKETVFDLASLTKPVATATSIMILIDRDKIDLNDYVSEHIPAFGCKGKEKVQIKHLLSHTSGLPAYTNANKIKEQFGPFCPEKVLQKICSFDALNDSGEEFRYSCLGYIVLCRIVEIVSGQSLEVFANENIFVPLKMMDTSFNPLQSRQRDIAATEIRKGKLGRGLVHDPLASLMGGVSGNAGLFSTAADLSIYCRMLLNGGKGNGRRILSKDSVGLLTSTQQHGRAYGYDVSSSYSWIKGTNANDKTFCHSGYTGTSLVCDPVNSVYLIILTNRAHPEDKGSVKSVRTRVADIVF